MTDVSLIDVASYVPGPPIAADYFAPFQSALTEDSAMFRAPRFRHFAERDSSAQAMIVPALRTLLSRRNERERSEIDFLITNVLLPDLPFTGSGAAVADGLGLEPSWIIDAHNGGCASFVHMLRIASALIRSGEARAGLICNVQNCAGPVMTQRGVRELPEAVVPGDGCGVAYVAASDHSPIEAITVLNRPSYAKDIGVTLDDGRKYWEPGTSPMHVGFTAAKVSNVVERGNSLVPEAAEAVMRQAGMSVSDIDVFITNQPNRRFLQTWHERLGIAPDKHLDTFDRFGNLFGAAVPVTLDGAIESGAVRAGQRLLLAGFAHAGDFAGAALVRWGGRAPMS